MMMYRTYIITGMNNLKIGYGQGKRAFEIFKCPFMLFYREDRYEDVRFYRNG